MVNDTGYVWLMVKNSSDNGWHWFIVTTTSYWLINVNSGWLWLRIVAAFSTVMVNNECLLTMNDTTNSPMIIGLDERPAVGYHDVQDDQLWSALWVLEAPLCRISWMHISNIGRFNSSVDVQWHPFPTPGEMGILQSMQLTVQCNDWLLRVSCDLCSCACLIGCYMLPPFVDRSSFLDAPSRFPLKVSDVVGSEDDFCRVLALDRAFESQIYPGNGRRMTPATSNHE